MTEKRHPENVSMKFAISVENNCFFFNHIADDRPEDFGFYRSFVGFRVRN